MNLQSRTITGFRAAFGCDPEGTVFVPGRVNLIGEHVDYNDGLVLPMPISAGTAISWGPGAGDGIEAVALDFGGERDRFSLAQLSPDGADGWQAYLRGTAAALAARGLVPAGTRMAIAGTIPRGSGLSSSASLCVAVGRALAAAQGFAAPNPQLLALAAQQAEHEWAGVHCGIMDQMAVAAGQPGHALLLDCADLATRQVALPENWAVMIVQSGVRRGLVDGHYNQRRSDCEAAAHALGLPSLRQADMGLLEQAALPAPVASRAHHVIEEIARVRSAVAAIEADDLAALGGLLRASHASLRDLFEVSEANVDRLADLLNDAIGAEGGARMTGGGFGGAVVAVLPAHAAERVRDEVLSRYTSPDPALFDITIERLGQHMAGATL